MTATPAPEGLFEALGDAVRRTLLGFLRDGERSAGELVDMLQQQMTISQPSVSQHLKVLRDAGLLTVRAAGTKRFYALEPAALRAAEAWLADLRG